MATPVKLFRRSQQVTIYINLLLSITMYSLCHLLTVLAKMPMYYHFANAEEILAGMNKFWDEEFKNSQGFRYFLNFLQ